MNTRPTRAPAPSAAETMTADVQDATFHEVERPNNLPAERRQQANNTLPSEGPVQQPSLPITPFAKLASAIAGVMAEIRPVEKSGWNDFHKYNYAKMGDLSIELTPLMGRHGIVIFQNEVDRAMFDDGKVISVRYQFTVVHSSGEIWPERPLITGMSRCRDKNGGFDDKSFNKAHTAARKYFLLSLFQIPTDDEHPDADAGQPQQQTAQRPQGQRRPVPGPDGKVGPHRVAIIPDEAPQTWATRYGEFVSKAKSKVEIDQWYDANAAIFERLKEAHPQVYNDAVDFMDACEAALAKVDPISSGKPAEKAKTEDFPGDTKPPARRPVPPPKVDDGDIPYMLDKALTDPERDWLKAVDEAYAECHDKDSLDSEEESSMMPAKDTVTPKAWAHAVKITAKHLARIQGS